MSFSSKIKNYLRYRSEKRHEHQQERRFIKKAKASHIYLEKNVKLTGARYFDIEKETRICEGCIITCIDHYFKSQYTPSLSIGVGSRIGPTVEIVSAGILKIGSEVFIGPATYITNVNHGMDPQSSMAYGNQPISTKPVVIGDRCWIGTKVIILPGVTIGSHCIIGAGSVVTKNIPGGCMAAGNPAKVIKKYDTSRNEWVKQV
jgi:acetyltransferase-like isoleucine patch superfamily enzyme